MAVSVAATALRHAGIGDEYVDALPLDCLARRLMHGVFVAHVERQDERLGIEVVGNIGQSRFVAARTG